MENIIIRNHEELNKKITIIKQDGLLDLHIISDFDRTLTKCCIEGKRTPSTPALVREGRYLSKEYVKKAFELHDIYRPFEILTKISEQKKNEKMIEWWTLHFKLLVDSGFNRKVINDIIAKKKMQMRQGSDEFFKLLSENKIPLLIFSAGMGDIIKEYLEYEDMMKDNVFLISNFFTFDEYGKANGYRVPLIHSLNKNEVAIKDTEYYYKVKNRKNVILLGDLLEDIQMSEGIEHDCIIRIGFLNENVEESIEAFSEKFDIVILNDITMDYVNELLKKIIGV